MGTMIQLTAADGHKFSAYRAEPKGKPKGALVVVMEIFGVNSHIRNVADEYAADGYLAIAPAMFDRVQPGLDIGYTPADIEVRPRHHAKMKLDDALNDVPAAMRTSNPRARSASSATAGAARSRGTPRATLNGLAVRDRVLRRRHAGTDRRKAEVPGDVPLRRNATIRSRSTSAKEFAAAHQAVECTSMRRATASTATSAVRTTRALAKLARERTLEFLAKHVG